MADYSLKNLRDVENSAPEGAGEGLEIIAIGADRPEGGDGELVRDWWTD